MVNIVTTTYYPDNELGRARAKQYIECVESWFWGLQYDNGLSLIVADDGSEFDFSGWTIRQERKGIGASLNAGFKAAFEHSDIAMYIVDDFMLNEKIDITPWVKLLNEHEDIGMVRIGMPHPGLTGHVALTDKGWVMYLDRHDFAYAMRPALFHKRFFDAYGWFKEEINCWECERLYNLHFCVTKGPEIVYALPCPWTHEDILPLGELEPGG